jgi:hypothetical protein
MRSIALLSKTFEKKCIVQTLIAAAIGMTIANINISDVSAMSPLVRSSTLIDFESQSIATPIVARRGGAARRTTVVGPRGGAASRTVVRRGPVVRPSVARHAAWVRPAHYRWAPGGAIAAGAALGFVTAATAVAWAGAPPVPGYCWFYTDPSRTQGFWDVCPR